MPTYKFEPDLNKEALNLFTVLETYNFDTKATNMNRIIKGETFTTNKYLSNSYMKQEEIVFVSDEPYISPILCCFNGSGKCELEVPDCGHLFDIYATTVKNPIQLYFNHNINNDYILITEYSSGIIFHNMAPAGIRIINAYCESNYSIALLLTNHFAENNG